jgi:hypothetical protein
MWLFTLMGCFAIMTLFGRSALGSAPRGREELANFLCPPVKI